MTRNPIYRAFCTSGLMGKLERSARDSGAHPKLFETTYAERAALRSMWSRGVIDYDEFTDLRRRVSRALHAAILRDANGDISFGRRLRTIKTLRKMCPPCLSSYAVRMGWAGRV